MYKIKFGTDGWRDIIAQHYTTENVRRVALATAEWLLGKWEKPVVIVGYDCRFAGRMFAEETTLVLASKGIHVILSEGFCSTPMVSLANVKLKANAGVIITASHNPPSYNGYKLKSDYGGPTVPDEVAAVENFIKDEPVNLSLTMDEAVKKGLVSFENLENLYIEHVKANFDMPRLTSYARHMAYDAMYGAGQNVIRRLLPEATLLHAEFNPGFNGVPPEPIAKNLKELSEVIAADPNLLCGLATDGDADRIGFFNSKGEFIDSHHLILLLTVYLTQYKKLKGKIVKSFSVSNKVDKLAKQYGIETITTKIGFKYICEIMISDDVLIGAEESGGIAIKGHIPERDGVWMGLVLLEFMAVTGKTIEQLISDVYGMIGSFAFERYDLHITEDIKQKVIRDCKAQAYKSFGPYSVTRFEDIDGYKFHFDDDQWVMIRPSGTEPVLRVYAESPTSKQAFAILDATKKAILG